MLQDIIERKVYASEEHKMMKGMIQEFISNEIMDHIDEWEKTVVSREIWKRAGELGLLCIDMLKYMVVED
jgi:acyl-CoA dehydrogenase